MNPAIEDLFGHMTGDKKYDKKGYHCVACKYELEQFTIVNPIKATKKVFWCEHMGCTRFGFLTVIAIVKNK